MNKTAYNSAKNIMLRIGIISLICSSLIISLPSAAQAAGCAYVCDDTANTAETICSKLGATVGATALSLDGQPDCAGTPSCSLNAKPVCCCQSATSLITPVGSTKVGAEAPRFTLPDWQIRIPTVNLTEPDCTMNEDGSYYCTIPWIGQYISGIYNYGLSVAGILAAIVLMAGGVLWLVSAGDASKITQAKELIIGSVTGLIILTSAYILLTQVNPELTQFRSIGIGTIQYQDFEPISSDGNANNSAECNNCVALTVVPVKNNNQININLAAKLTKAYNASGTLGWRVTEAYPPTSSHNSTCHYNGMCADVALTGEVTCADVNKLIVILQQAGLSVLNEYPDCDGTQTAYTTGGHLHVK